MMPANAQPWLSVCNLVCACGERCASCSRFRAAVPIYDSTQIAFDRYTVVKRIGGRGLEFGCSASRGTPTRSAQAALLNEAAPLGADGVINLHCLGQTDGDFQSGGVFLLRQRHQDQK